MSERGAATVRAVAIIAAGACVVAAALAACGRPRALDASAATEDTAPRVAAVRPPDAAAKAPEPSIDISRPTDLADLVASRPDVFVGLGVERRGVVIVALNPGIDPGPWRPIVDRYAGGQSHLVTVCTRSLRELTGIANELTARRWSPRATSISFAVVTDPVTCSVQLSSDQLTDEEQAALLERYGDALTIVRAAVSRA
ncbi:hypothetical protein [Luedemannella helvata]|uniref:Uncharacterized protein n=1 Tax=Luedemannella helvata TaxID=349315 RepID=A0ABN2KN81_9ACTN